MENIAKGERVLLLSDDIIDNRAFHGKAGKITWEESALKYWLNELYIKDTFTEKEMDAINGNVFLLNSISNIKAWQMLWYLP